MRLYEFANAQEQLALWKLISDSVWDSISAQAQAQEQKRATDAKAAKKAPKSAPIKLSAKRASPPTPPKPRTPPKKTDSKTDARTDAEAKQKSALQTQKPQVLPKVFSNTSKSNLATPQTPMTSASSLSPQSAAQTSSQRVIHDPNSVANIQRQLDPLAFDPTIKKLTS